MEANILCLLQNQKQMFKGDEWFDKCDSLLLHPVVI